MIIKFIKKKVSLIKICAVFTTICFVVSTLGANLYAIPLAENANQKYEDVFNKTSSISAEYGKITSSKDGNSDITVINIQDLHCHPQTQRNIAKIIGQIADKYNLKKIYVEGGYGDIDVSWLDSIKDEKIKRQIIEGLLEEGILTGSEYYKLTNNNEVELKGIDEEEIHKDNVRRLSWIIENQPKYKDVITKVENEINILEKIYVNSRNERFNRDTEKYLTSEIDSRRFYRQLAKYVKDINENPDKYNNITAIRLEDYPNIMKFIALRKTSQDIDVREVTQQLQMVINELKSKLPYNVYTKLLSETENLSDSQKVVELVTMFCNKEGIDLEHKYKSLYTFLESNEINRQLNTVELVLEERQLLSEIRKALSYNNEEYEITFLSDFSRYFKDYLEYKLTDADWKYFESAYDQFRTLYSKYAVVDRIWEIDGDFDELNKYYKINDQRNNIFVANLLKGEEISVSETDRVRQEEEILKDSKEVIIAVTGGFHSSELEEILAQKEVNTIVITPSIFEGIEKATRQYKGIIKEQSKEFQHQALAYRILSSLPNQEQKVYLYGALKALIGNNLDKLKEFLGEDVDLDALETEFQNLQLSDEQSQLNVSITVKALETAVDLMIDMDWLPKEGGKAIFAPNVSEIMWKAAKALVDAGIFLSNGPIFVAEQQGLPEVKETTAEVYSRMPAIIQEALFAQEGLSTKEGDERVTEEESVVEEDAQKTKEPETVKENKEEEEVDTSKVTPERRRELLNRFYNNNTKALNLLINVCCRKSVDFDLSKDSRLLDMFIRKFNSYNYSLEQMESIIVRAVEVSKRFYFDTDLKFSCFEKFVDDFDIVDKDDNGEREYIKSFRKLFSLSQANLEFFYEKIDGTLANELFFYCEDTDIDKNLTFLFEKYGEELSELDDYSKLIELLDNMDKLDYSVEDLKAILGSENYDDVRYTPKGLFAYLMSLPRDISDSILKTSKNPSQFLRKLIASKKFYFIGQKSDIIKLLFDNADKFYGLDPIEFSYFTRLDEKAMSFVLKYARNSSDIKNILTICQEKGLSTSFNNLEGVKDFNDPRFKALVKYISMGDRKFYTELFEFDKKIVALIADSVDDGEFVRDYLLNPEYRDIYKGLFDKLIHPDLDLKNIAVENNHFALKLILNKDFKRMLTESRLDNISDTENIVARYYSAIAVSRMMYDGAGREIKDYDFNNEEFMNLVKKATNMYIRMMKAMLNIILIDENTKIYALCNSERAFNQDRFNVSTLREIIKHMGIEIEIPEENVYRRLGNDTNASRMWLRAIEEFEMSSDKTKGYFVFRGHGGEESLLVYDPKAKDNGLATGHEEERIKPEQLADSLFKLATRTDKPVDLRNITIDLSCCHSYFFARNVYKILEEKYREKGIEGSFPTIITAAGLETKTGITDFQYMEGNLHKGIKKLLRNYPEGKIPVLSLGMIGVSEYMFRDSNITMFTSFFNKTILRDLARTKKEIHDYVNSEQTATEQQPEISEKGEEMSEQVVGEGSGKLSSVLPVPVTEASIFKEDKYAPIWEELFYRFAPALILTVLVSVTMIFAPAGFVLFTKIGFAVILALFQKIFVKAHIVTDWLKAKDSGGKSSSEEVSKALSSDTKSKTVDFEEFVKDDNLTVEEKINRIFKTVKERLFAIFSDAKDAERFKIFYKSSKIAAEHRDGLIIPTIAFTIPYVAAMFFFPSIQAVAIATIVSMALHAINNVVANLIKKKGLLQKKKRDIDFQDIRRRIKHVKLLIENPNVEKDLPELKEGFFSLKFGLERKVERRAESLLEYEKIRIFFINRLKEEMARKEEIKAEIEKIKKERKTKKNKTKIQELEEQLEIIEKEYPSIYKEFLFADTKEVEKTIDKIDALLPIFEEIDIILDNIENFKLENADDEDAYKEISALEEDFLDFAENTFMNSLMFLYNNQKTTGIHVRRVVGDSNLIGTKMLSGNNVRMMYKLMLSSILHDIGKNLVPLQILDKQGSFDRLERNIMEFHVVFGGIILRSSILRRLSYTAENHHRYTLKTKMDDLGKETEVGDLHIPTISSLDEEKEEHIERIVKFLEEINPDLSFDSESQYPKSLEDIKSILEDNDMDLTESQQEKLDDLLREIEQIEEEVLIAKIVSLADVFEAVSPKLSFDSERTYQFPQKIRDISSMLENIDIDLTESQKREVIVLLAEIAQIDSEEDAAKKQEMEQKFIKKVLYDRSKSAVIKYVREKNYEFVRENAFRIIFTKYPKDIFEELGQTKEEFMAAFENDPKGTIDKCMSLVDADKFEFDADVIRAFLEFYFSSEDIRVNDTILESLNKSRESDFIVYIKDALYSVHKLLRDISRALIRFAPVIASIFSEEQEGVSVKEKFNIDTVINYTVTIKRRNGDTHFLYFDEKGFQQMGRDSGITMSMGSYGIQEIKYDEDGKIVDIILEPGATIDTDASGGEILVGSEAENLSFEDIEEQIKENYERKHHQKLEQEGFLLKPIMEDTGTTEKVDVYLDDDVKTILATIEDAINNNKLMVIHVFKEGFKTQNLSLWQRYQKYKVVYGLLDSRSKFESTFSKTSEIEEQFLKQIEDGLSEEERDMEWIKRNAAKTFFALREVLKNNFDHGNLGLFEYPIALHISKDNNGRVTEFSTYNLSTKPITLDRAEEKSLSDLMYEAYISGSHKGAEYMTDSFFTNLEYGDDIKISVGEEVYRIYRTKVTLKTEQEQEQALEKYNQYRQQKAEERRRYEQASEAEKRRMEEIQRQKDLEDFWGMQTRDTVSRLYNRGLTKYLRQYLKQTGKLVENLTKEESTAIKQKAEKYRFTFPGLVYGTFLEIFALWEPNFVDKHDLDPSKRAGMIAVVWTIRALSIGLGLTATFLSLSALPVSTILLTAVTPAIFGATTISSSFIIHLLWNIGAVLTGQIVDNYRIHVKRDFVYEAGKAMDIEDFIDRTFEITKGKETHFLSFGSAKISGTKDSETKNQKEKGTFKKYGIEDVRRGKGGSTIILTLQEGYTVDGKSTVELALPNKNEHTYITISKGDEKYIIRFNRDSFSEIEVKLNGETVTNWEDLQGIANIEGHFLDFSEGLKIIESLNHHMVRDYTRQPFTIQKEGREAELILFDSKTNSLFRVLEYGILKKIEPKQLSNYGIKVFEAKAGKITSLMLDSDAHIRLAARQSVGIVEAERERRMEQLAKSRAQQKGVQLVPIQASFTFEKIIEIVNESNLFSDDIKKEINEQIKELRKNRKLSPEQCLEQILEKIGLMEEDRKTYVERILSECMLSEIDAILKGLNLKRKKEVLLSMFDEENIQQIYGKALGNMEEAEIDAIIKKLVEDKELMFLIPYQQRRVLLRAGIKEEEIEFDADGHLSTRTKNALKRKNSDSKEVEINTFKPEELLENLAKNDYVLIPMLIDALNRAFDLDRDTTTKEKISSLEDLVEYLKSLRDPQASLRGYFGETYLANTTFAGEIDGVKLRLQLPKDNNAVGIDLIDPVTGMKIKVKIGRCKTATEALSRFPEIPIFCSNNIKNSDEHAANRSVQQFVELKRIEDFARTFIGLIKQVDSSKSASIMLDRIIDPYIDPSKNYAELLFNELKKAAEKNQSEDSSILPENMGLVNRIMQSRFGNAFIAATVVAFRESFASSEPNFVDLHQTATGKIGAQQVASLANRYNITEKDTITTKIIKSILGIIFRGASIVRHIAIDYRYIKASGLKEAINMFGKNTYMDEYGQIRIPPVLIVDDLTGLENLKNTGIKVNGRYIYQVGQKGILVYGAEGVDYQEISTVINESQMIKNAIEQMIREKGYEGVTVEVDGVTRGEGEGVSFDRGITIVGNDELENKSAEYIDGYVSSSIELRRTVGIMYSQKALISLESIDDTEKLKQALYQGRARKIISMNQYNLLKLSQEEIMTLRKNGIEIYVDSNEIDMNLKAMGIVGQIVRNNDNKMFIHDYYAQEKVEIEEISDGATITDIESKLLNSQNPIMIDIKVLAKTFQRENVLTAYKGLNNLIGNLKLKTGIGELNKSDIMSLIYNLDYNKLPLLSMLDESKSLQEYEGKDIEEFLNTTISNLDTNTEIKIILKAIKKNKNFNEEDYNEFVQIIKERILAKTALVKNYKEFGLKDKKLEILLGEMLYKQLPFAIEDKDLSDYRNNVDITYINERNERVDVQGENGLMEKIKQDTEKVMRDNDRVAINSIIDIILTYGDSYKEKQLTKQLDVNDARNYRAMMAAA